MTADDKLRQRAEELLAKHKEIAAENVVFADEHHIDAIVAFAAEQKAEARAEVIAQCLALRDEKLLCPEDEKHDNEIAQKMGEGTAWNFAIRSYAEAIARLSPAADMVLVPMEPTEVMMLAGERAGIINKGGKSFVVIAECYKAMIAKAGE
jgi:hypothetical protein